MRKFITFAASAALLGCCSSAALAQALAAPAADPDVQAVEGGDIVVTAQKREQRIQDVPMTVSAVTGARMAELGVNSLAEVALYIPGLRIQEQSANNPGFVIRGITSDSGSSQQGARVSL
ncbi:MAG: TonB-dependent receptor, partial [Sphingomonas sp.]